MVRNSGFLFSRFVLTSSAMAAVFAIGSVMERSDSARLVAIYSTPADQPDQRLIFDTKRPLSDLTTDVAAQAPMTHAPEIPGHLDRVTLECLPTLQVADGPAALMDVTVSAPCFPLGRFALYHEGLIIPGRTDQRGAANVVVPALRMDAVIMASFADGTTAMVKTSTPSLTDYERVVVQWQGDQGLHLHAFEFDAVRNSDGHVSSDRPQSIAQSDRGDGGFLLQYGMDDRHPPKRSEVYTFPSRLVDRDRAVSLTIEAEITDENCGQDVAAQTLQFRPDGGLMIQDLSFTLPPCQSIGTVLVLDSLLEPMTPAQR